MKQLYGEDRLEWCPENEWYQGDPRNGILKREWIDMMDAKRDWEAEMELKYRDAALRPWLPVAPDTPRPESRHYINQGRPPM